MKKLIAVLLAVVLSCSLMCTAFASTPTIKIYDFDGNEVENPDLSKPWLYGAVFNEDGTMAPQPRYDAVNSSITLSSGQMWRSYQYQLSNVSFGAGIEDPAYMSGNTLVAIEKASSVGGSRTIVKSKTVKTTTAYEDASVTYSVGSTSTYLDATFTNKASSSSTFTIFVGWD